MNNIKLFVFDFGEVMKNDHHVWGNLFEKLGFPNRNVRDCGPNSVKAINVFAAGKINEQEFWELVKKDLKKDFPCDNILYDAWNGLEIPGIYDLVGELKAKGYRVVCGTNTIDPYRKKIQDLGYYDIFDKIYNSDGMGLIKPNPEFWFTIADQENVNLDEMFFVDDGKPNILTTKSLRMPCHLFENGTEGLRADLKERGLL